MTKLLLAFLAVARERSTALMLAPALAGFGLAYLPEEPVGTHLAEGRLVRGFADWCEPFSGFHL